jgi:hypothetical protein
MSSLPENARRRSGGTAGTAGSTGSDLVIGEALCHCAVSGGSLLTRWAPARAGGEGREKTRLQAPVGG